jgi:hypothetical protein
MSQNREKERGTHGSNCHQKQGIAVAIQRNPTTVGGLWRSGTAKESQGVERETVALSNVDERVQRRRSGDKALGGFFMRSSATKEKRWWGNTGEVQLA